MKNYSILLCMSHLHDRNTGLHSYINCIDSGSVPDFPAALPGFTAITKWICPESAEGLSAELVLHAPGKKKETLGLLDEFNVQAGLFTLIMTVERIEVKKAGRYEIQVLIRDKKTGKPFSSIKHPLQITTQNKE